MQNRIVAINGQTQVVTAVLVHKAADKVRFIFAQHDYHPKCHTTLLVLYTRTTLPYSSELARLLIVRSLLLYAYGIAYRNISCSMAQVAYVAMVTQSKKDLAAESGGRSAFESYGRSAGVQPPSPRVNRP